MDKASNRYWLRIIGKGEEIELELPKDNSRTHVFKTNGCFMSTRNE